MRRLRRFASAGALILAVVGLPASTEIPPEEMILVPKGAFRMGEHGERHGVYLDDFYIDKYEVTNARYRRFVDARRYARLPTHWRDGTYPAGEADHPVTHVDWYDARAYCRWAGKRLPTEAEWEKAARGTDGRKYPWGDQFDRRLANVGRKMVAPVGSFEAGKSPYGVHDMSGNVWEWTSTLLKPYPYHADDGREGFEASGYRVLRGGAFPLSGHLSRAARRGDGHPAEKDDRIGFRCVASEKSTFLPPELYPPR